MSNTQKVKITLKGSGLTYEGDIDEALAGQIMAICLSSQPGAAAGDGAIPAARVAILNRQRESAAEYVNRHAPKRNPDKILTLAGFLRDSHNKDSFQQGEIKSLFRDAGEIVPANLTRDFNWTVSSGWIAPDPGKKGSYYITSTGQKVLEGQFPENLVKRTKGKVTGRKRAKKA